MNNKKKIISILVCMLVLCVTVSAVTGEKTKNTEAAPFQPPVEWSETYGGDMIDWGNCIQQTSDGGYIISGTYGRNAWSLWYSYFYLLKIDASGHKEWNQVYGPYNGEHVAKSIKQTSDGGYIIVGYQGITYMYDVVVQKTDELGNIVWEYTFGDADEYDLGQSVQLTSDGGYIITGITNSYGAVSGDALLIKLDVSGNTQWIKTVGGSDSDAGYCVQQTSDGGYIISGETCSYSSSGDVYLVKTDSSGNEQWHQVFGGENWDGAYFVEQTTDDGYILSGWYGNEDWTTDVYVIKTDSFGNQEWTKNFGRTDYDEGYCVQQTFDGGYFITGYSNDPINYDPDVFVIKTDGFGNEEWNQTVDRAHTEDYGYYGIQTTDEGYIVSGSTGIYLDETVDVFVLKFQGTNQPPEEPTNPSPANGSVDVDLQVYLSWVSDDPDEDLMTYDVYFGTSSTPSLVATNLSVPSYDPGVLVENTTYYWKVKAKDIYGASTEGPLWTFITKQVTVQVEITEIKGGFGASAVISNIGTSDAEHVYWTLEVHGGLFGRINETISGTLQNLAGGASETVSMGIFFGIGKIQISASAADVSVVKEGIQFVFFTYVK
jgi:hypothetical protein